MMHSAWPAVSAGPWGMLADDRSGRTRLLRDVECEVGPEVTRPSTVRPLGRTVISPVLRQPAGGAVPMPRLLPR